MRTILLLFVLTISTFTYSQSNSFRGKKIASQQDAVLDYHFKDFQIYEIPTKDIFSQIKSKIGESQVELKLGKEHHWQLSLFPSDMRGPNYSIQTATQRNHTSSVNKSFEGYEQLLGGGVRLTVDVDFFYGYVETGGERFFVEPLWYINQDAPRNQFIVYAESDVIPHMDNFCAAEEMKKHSHKHEHDHSHDHNEESSKDDLPEFVGLCLDVEVAIASDFSMFQKYGSITAVENHNIGVMNNVQGNYDDEFDDELNFVIVTQFVSDCSTCDPWTTSTAAGTLLSSFRSWGNNGGFGSVTYDVAQIWTDRDFNGSTVGVAYLGTVCGFSRYQALQDFSSTAWRLRVLVSHELGHNFDAVHDASGSGFIMAPAVNNTNTWSTTSINDINSFVASINCLAQCAALVAPTPGFTSNVQSICEGNDVQFFDQSSGTIASRSWTFVGGVPAASTDANPVVSYPIAGTFPVALTVTNAAGSNTQNQVGYITVGPNGTNILLYDAFENGLGNWTIENPNNNITWVSTAVQGSNVGSNAVMMDNWSSSGIGDRDGLVSGAMDFSGYTNVTLTFDHAYALWSGNTNQTDSLIIKVSTDGGNTFPNTVFEGGDNGTGNFATASPQGEFIPDNTTDWCYAGNFGASCFQVDLSSFVGQTNVVVKFENVHNFGNRMYLDNIMISSDCQVILPPVADFVGTPTEGCIPMTVNFTDLSQNGPSSWSWTFPGGTPNTSNAQNPVVVYNTPGIYDVILTTTNAAGTDVEAKAGYIEVEAAPMANFNFTVNGNQVTFTNLSTGGGSYNWTFGDGNLSTAFAPTHTYANDGTYDVTLVALNDCGINAITQQVTIVTAPTAGFMADVTNGCAPLTVNFTDQSSSNVVSWIWTFIGGNPSSSTVQNPTVTYDNPGTYSVTLTVTNAAGNNTFTQTNYITVDATPSPSFSQTINGLTVDFTNNSTNANSYSWDFGDGNSSTDTNPTHTYASDGTYTVVLTATNDCGSETSSQMVTIITAPTAGFSSNVTSGCAPLTVQFNDQSSTNSTSWSWTFPGGDPSTSNAQNPTVTYNTAGTYSVTLEVSNSAGMNTTTQTNLIIVNDVPTSDFSQNINGQTVDFFNNSTNADSYIWNFGDGNTSTATNPTHTYNADGQYTVTLTAINVCGSVTSTQTITISTMPVAGFSSNVTSGCADLTVQFNDMSSSNATSWNWSFPGGNPSSSNVQNPVVVYENAGTYSVTLEVGNSVGNNIVTQTNLIVVDDVPMVGFSQTTNNLTVSFANNSTNANSYSWDFGDGNSSTDQNPTHTYAMDGTYNVVLTATNGCGSVTSNQTIVISTLPVAGFSSNVTSGCADLTVQFNDMSSSNSTSWNWSFPGGNPSSSTVQNPVVVYENAGTYSVTLEVSNSIGNNIVTQTNLIVVDDVPTVGFSQMTNNLTVSFTNNSTNANSYSWDFGDGNSSTDQNPTHTYGMDGTYNVVLTATNGCGSVTSNQTIVVSTLPVAGFSSNVTSGCADLTVQFNDMSSSNSTSWNWSFPGGNPSSSTVQNPVVVYENAGTYSVTLEVGNSVGNNIVTQTNLIVVDDVPTVGFSQTTNNLTVSFTNNSTNANSYSWDFGDGNTSNDQNPTHTYAMDGTYNVVLTATNGCGSVTSNQMISVNSAPVANFNSNVTSGCADLTVQFNDQSSANATSWNWSFPGGNPSSSTLQNPVVVYENAGTYSVTLEVGNSVGNNMVTQTNLIVVDDVPSANFTSTVNGPQVDFTNQSSNATSYFWNFGDGNTSTNPNPSHQYSLNGDYTVTLEATNACGTTTTTSIVSITSSVIAGFGSNITTGCMPLTVEFSNQSINATSLNWTFVGGTPSTSTEENPTVVYQNGGVYTVILEAINATGSSTITETAYIVVESLPLSNFMAAVNGMTVDFTNLSGFADSQLWDFGDGNTSTAEHPQHTYANIGIYTVTLTTFNGCGSDVFTFDIDVGTAVTTSFSAAQTTGCAPMQIQFMDESSNNVSSWNWTFQGGTPATSTEQNPIVTFSSAGVYSVTLEASNPFNSNTFTQTNYITISDVPTAGFSSTVNNAVVDFNNTSTNATSYSWTFGDGETSNSENPQHTYTEDGTYQVTLAATNDCGTVTTQETITIVTPVTAGFTANELEGCAGLEVQFSDASSENVTAWNWTFSGGNPSTSNAQNPVVTYNTPGVYAVTLEVSNSVYNNTITETSYITILDVPSVGFSSTTNGATVNFTNNSTGGNSYAWTFGDGNSSNDENPMHTYAMDGTYTVTLEVTNDCGTVSTQETVTIVTPVTAGFTANVTNGCAGLEVQFLDNSSDNVTAWNWSFPGGNPSTSNAQNPIVIYNTPGVYAMTLETSNSMFSATQTETGYIVIDDVPTAGFTSMNVGGGMIDFTNTSVNGVAYSWDFGDGSMPSNEENPTHTYTTDGTYTVTLTATNDCGSNTVEIEINVALIPLASFSIQNLEDCVPATLQFLDESSDNTTSWNWTFQGGSPNTATVQNPAITFNQAGTFEITLVASNAAGSSSFSMEITLGAAPTVDFTSSVDVLTTTFTNLTTDATSYSWDFGDGNSSNDENPIHEYAAAGNYTVILTATNDCGSTSFSSQVEIVGPQAVASFSTSGEDGCTPFTVNFNDTSTGNPTVWNWSFPGGTPASSTEQNPTVVYNNAGTFDVTLMVTNPAGQNTIEQTNYITVGESPMANYTGSVDVGGVVTFTNTSTSGDNYEWLFGDGNASNEESPVHVYDTSGVYTVLLIVTNACGTDTMSQDFLVQITSTGEVSFLEKLELYPNPNDGQFILHIEGQPTDDLNIRLYNIIGQQILEEELDFRSGSLIKTYELQDLPAATYILQIQSEGKVAHRKVVKE